jgi:hypothetical protein
MPTGKNRSYRGLLGYPIFRPELWQAMIFWNDDSNRDLLSNSLLAHKIITDFTKAEEDSHLQQMASHLGIVKNGGGIWPQAIWHEGWERDLTIALAAKVFPEFSRSPPKKRGTKKTATHDVDLFNAVLGLRSRNIGMSVLSACAHLSKQTGGKWCGKKAAALRVAFKRFEKTITSKSDLAKQFDRVTEFARRSGRT